MIDNSVNCHACIKKEYFTDVHASTKAETQLIGSIRTVGDDGILSGFSKLHVAWTDYKGKGYLHIINNVCYVQNSLINPIHST